MAPIRDSLPATPLRVLHLVHWLARGGIESWLLTALRNAPRNELLQDVCCKGPNRGYLLDDFLATGTQVLHCPMGITLAPFMRRFTHLLQQSHYDLVHVHTHVHSGPPVYAARRAGVPVVTTFHNSMHFPETTLTKLPVVRSLRALYTRYSMRYALLNSNACTGVSEDVSRAVERTAGLDSSSCRVAHLGVEPPAKLNIRDKERLCADIGIASSCPTVVHVGSFTPRKNHAGLLQTFRLIVDALPDAMLVLIGDGPQRAEVQALIAKLKLGRNVKLLGLRDDVSDVLQLGDLFLFPSITEGLSLAFVEASAVGLPIVASNIPGNREASNAGAFARLLDPHDSQGMAAASIALLRDKQEAAHLGQLGMQHFESQMSIAASLTRYESIYREVLAERETHTATRIAA